MARRSRSIPPLGAFVEHLVPEWAPEPEDAEPDERDITLKAYAAIPPRVLDDLRGVVSGRIFDPAMPGDQGTHYGFYRSGARDLFDYILRMIETAKAEARDANQDRA